MENNSYFTQTHERWMRQKRGKLSSSEIWKLFVGSKKKDALFGDTAITYITDKISEITSSVIKTDSDWKQTEWGKANESDAVKEFKARTGLSVIYHGLSNPVFYPFNDYVGGSPDGDVIEESAGVEIKCPYNETVHTKRLIIKSVEEFKKDQWQEYCQCQCNMYIMKKSHWYFASFDPRKSDPQLRMKIVKLYPDSEWVAEFEMRIEKAIEMMAEILHCCNKYLSI